MFANTDCLASGSVIINTCFLQGSLQAGGRMNQVFQPLLESGFKLHCIFAD